MSRIPSGYLAADGRTYKFQDCISCSNRRQPDVCRACTNGEMFEPEDCSELDFDQPLTLEDLS